MTLPERQQRFVRLYAVNGGNGARAARGAGYAVASSSRSGGAPNNPNARERIPLGVRRVRGKYGGLRSRSEVGRVSIITLFAKSAWTK